MNYGYFNQQRPDWVMLGTPTDDGRVRLIASQSLSQVQLEVFYDYPVTFHPKADGSCIHRYVITAEMHTVVIIDAADYTAAFNSLFKQWTPESPVRPALAGMPEPENP